MYRDTVDIMDAVYRDAVHRRQRRDEEELMLTAAVEHRGELCADVAAQRGVGLFEDAADVLFRGARRKSANLPVCRLNLIRAVSPTCSRCWLGERLYGWFIGWIRRPVA